MDLTISLIHQFVLGIKGVLKSIKGDTYHPLESHSISLSDTIQIRWLLQSQWISNQNLCRTTKMGKRPIQAFMENGKKLDIIQIVQSLSKRFLSPLIPNERS